MIPRVSALADWSRLWNRPVDASGLAAFRILFGSLMAFAMARFLAKGWVEELYVKPTFFFRYEFFPWAKPLGADAMHALFVVLAVLALCIAAGFCYRFSAVLFFLGFTYVELIDKTTYLNHYYLVSLLSGLMIFLPAHRLWSVDAWLRPALHSDSIPGWALAILRFQIAVVYLFAGLAKLNSDWIFEAQPMRLWLAARNDLPLIGPMLDELWVAYAASWLGALYDLAIVGLLCHRRTRSWAFAAVVGFHLGTWILFRIGMFPWLMIASASLFFAPDWPRRWLKKRATVGDKNGKPLTAVPSALHPFALAALACYAGVQLFLPLRQYFQKTPSAWTYEGFNWSWRVMLVEKSGYVEFRALDPATGQRWKVRAEDYLTPRQAQFMAQDPAMIRALARHIAEVLGASRHPGIQVFADAYASLNGGPSQRLIDPTVDLAAPTPAAWIVALRK